MRKQFQHRPTLVHLRRCTTSRSELGMTLIEIMVVIAIIGIVAGGTALVLLGKVDDAKIKQAKTDALNVQKASEMYYLDNDSCPSASDLISGKYIKKQGKGANDPWGNPFNIECSGGEITVSSQGNGKDPETAVTTGNSDD